MMNTYQNTWKRRAALAVTAILVSLFAGVASASATNFADVSDVTSSTWVTNARVQAAVPGPGDTTFIGGPFSLVGPYTGAAARLTTDTAEVLDLPRANNTFECSIEDGDGGVYLGGWFTALDKTRRMGLGHVLADGTVDPDFEVTLNEGGAVTCMALVGETLYIGGYFSTVNGVERANLAAVNAATGALVSDFNVPVSDPPECMLVDAGQLWIGGYFWEVDRERAPALAKIDLATGHLAPHGVQPIGGAFPWVTSMLMDDGTLYVGGLFDWIGEDSAHNLGAINPATGVAYPWDPHVGGTVYALATNGDVLVAGGAFDSVDSDSEAAHIASFDLVDRSLTDWRPGLDDSITSLAFMGDTLYAGGYFKTVGLLQRKLAAAWDFSGDEPTLTGWDPQPFSGYWFIGSFGDDLIAGGYMSSGRGYTRPGIAQLDEHGVSTDWLGDPDDRTFSGTVDDVFYDGTDLFVSGAFTASQYDASVNVLRLDPADGHVLAAGQVSGEGPFKMAVDDASVYVSDGYAVSKFTRPGLERMEDWSVNLDGAINCLAEDGDQLFIGGSFLSTQGMTAPGLLSVAKSDGSLTGWDPHLGTLNLRYNGPEVFDVMVKDGKLYAVGRFGFAGSAMEPRWGAAAFDLAAGALDPDFAPQFDADPSAITSNGPNVIIGGAFQTVGDVPRPRIAELTAYGQPVPADTEPYVQGSPDTLLVRNGQLYVGGAFTEEYVEYYDEHYTMVWRSNLVSYAWSTESAPPMIRDFEAARGASDTDANLSWTNPDDPSFDSVRIFRSTTGPAMTQEGGGDQELFYEGSAESTTDPDIAADTLYIYTAFARNEQGEWGPRVVTFYQLGMASGRLETSMTCSATPAEVAYLGRVTVATTLCAGGVPKEGADVELWTSTDNGGSWKKAADGTDLGDGRYSASLQLKASTCFMWRFDGDSGNLPCISTGVTMTACKVSLSTPVLSNGAPRTRRPFTISGSILPGDVNARKVRVSVYRWKSGRWSAYRTPRVGVKAGGTRYSLRLRLPSAGRWKVVASYVDSNHSATKSAARFFRIRK